jgi:phosphoribosylformylglycinamidine synthase
MVLISTPCYVTPTGRHLVMMPHIERSTFQWNWAHYPKDRNDEVSPWHEAFVNEWIDQKIISLI